MLTRLGDRLGPLARGVPWSVSYGLARSVLATGTLLTLLWRDGTALYYWLDDPAFGPASWLRRLTYPLLLNPVVVALLTWGTLALEFSLGIALFLRPARGAACCCSG